MKSWERHVQLCYCLLCVRLLRIGVVSFLVLLSMCMVLLFMCMVLLSLCMCSSTGCLSTGSLGRQDEGFAFFACVCVYFGLLLCLVRVCVLCC